MHLKVSVIRGSSLSCTRSNYHHTILTMLCLEWTKRSNQSTICSVGNRSVQPRDDFVERVAVRARNRFDQGYPKRKRDAKYSAFAVIPFRPRFSCWVKKSHNGRQQKLNRVKKHVFDSNLLSRSTNRFVSKRHFLCIFTTFWNFWRFGQFSLPKILLPKKTQKRADFWGEKCRYFLLCEAPP
jgi:hypothetical protein